MLANLLGGSAPGQPSSPDAEAKKFENRLKLIDLLVKFIAGVVITCIIWHLGNRAEDARHQIAEANRKLTYMMEFSAKQKELDVNLGMRMFESLLKDYLQPSKGNGDAQERHRKQMLLLRLVALNFQDVPINLKPLFEELDRQLATPQGKAELRDIALELARRQAYRLTFKEGLDSGELMVTAGQEIPRKDLLFNLKINKVNSDHLLASLHYEGRTIGPFTVSMFDMPLVDNIKIASWRVSVLLLKCDGNQAMVRLVVFPSDLAADRFDLKELTREQRYRP